MSVSPAAQGWAQRAAWSVLDCAFGDGEHFFALWSAWRADPLRPRMLHYVAIAETAQAFLGADSTHPLGSTLQAACKDLQPGFNRVALDSGQLSLTVCLGHPAAMVDAQDFQADQIVVTDHLLAGDKWAVKALARCCKRGTHIASNAAAPHTLSAAWLAAGFQPCQPALTSIGLHTIAVYEPTWTLKRTRHDNHAWQRAPGRCAVVGAGLSGAAVARALALRGWRVTVLDQCAKPAGGASGLPVGLVVPHVSADDSPRSRLSRAGARITLAQAQQHLRDGEDWAPSGVTEMRLNPRTQSREPLWHAMAGWIKPAALVNAWLQTPGVTFLGHTQVANVRHDGLHWQLLDNSNAQLAQADVVVLANAMGCRALLQDLPLPAAWSARLQALHPMYGTMTLGRSEPGHPFPQTPVNGMGSFVPLVPAPGGALWAAGATFETESAALADTQSQHRANLHKLRSLLPAVADVAESQFQRNELSAWSGERCVAHDRLPWVGPVELKQQPNLWVCAGMGSRGLSFAALCAEFLAARVGAEPLPAESGLLRSLDINRTASPAERA